MKHLISSPLFIRLWGFGVIALVALACGIGVADSRAPEWSPIVYPMQRLPLIFSHNKHLSAAARRASRATRPRRRRAPPSTT